MKMIEKELTSYEIKMYRLGELEHEFKANEKRFEAVGSGNTQKDLETLNEILSQQKDIAKKFLEISQQLMPLSFKTHEVIKRLEAQWG